MILAFFKINHVIDLITNSSSELFVLEAKTNKRLIVELVNEALKGATYISEDSIEDRIFKEGNLYDADWKIEEALKAFPENVREELKAKYFTNPNYYGVAFDRDWVYRMDNDQGIDVRSEMASLGFEMVDSDY
jgi:hypothetical protein